ncbi:MAG: cysteine hydrolase [Candidatus Roizmanbacteria bacterium]|nr:cysteine hydrolase [Candidatus Roizmanbacteria bacterium]
MEFDHLAVIDMQRNFLRHRPLREYLNITDIIKSLIHDARTHDIPVTYAMYDPERWGELTPEMNPLSPEEVIVKEYDDAFTSPEFVKRMKGYGLICIAGCHLEYCIRDTIRGAIRNGHSVVAYQQALLPSSEGSPKANATLRALRRNRKVQLLNQYPSDTRVLFQSSEFITA